MARRSLLSFLRRSAPQSLPPLYPELVRGPPPPALLSPTDLFHPLPHSPIPALRALAERIRRTSPCPVTARSPLGFTDPESGFPSHATQQAYDDDPTWVTDHAHRLAEINEDLHDLCSGRPFPELDPRTFPGPQPYEETANLSSWDTFLYTRHFSALHSDRSLRHLSHLLSYPITIASVLDQHGPFAASHRRPSSSLTSEGATSFSALRHTLYTPNTNDRAPKPPMRVFVLGARSESTLPQPVWAQLSMLFPQARFEIYLVGPETTIPQSFKNDAAGTAISVGVERDRFPGFASHRLPLDRQTTIFNIQGKWQDLHPLLGPFDPYTDIFFAFHPGFGFPSMAVEHPDQAMAPSGSALPETSRLQISHEWREALAQVISSNCPLVCTAFSPTDMQRDVTALLRCPEEGIADEWEWLVRPTPSAFGSTKWDLLEQDLRVGIRSNYGLYAIRGKRKELVASQSPEHDDNDNDGHVPSEPLRAIAGH